MPEEYTQRNRHIAFSVDDRPDEEVLLLRSFSWREELGRLPSGTLDLVSRDHEIKYSDYVGKKVTVRMNMEEEGERYFHGYITSIRQGTPEGRLAHYVAEMHPWLWFLTQTSDCRIFQGDQSDGITAPQVIEQVFKERALGAFENRLANEYRSWEYCVQYRESEFNFVSRLMEQEGCCYFFVHGTEDHAMFLVDDASCFEDAGYAPFRYRATRPPTWEGPYVYEWSIQSEFTSGKVLQRDWNFKDSSVMIDASVGEQENWDGDPLKLYDYPGEYVNKSDGDAQANVRWEELQALKDVRYAVTDARGLYAGGLIHLKDHPRREECQSADGSEDGRQYLLTSLSHHASTGDYGVSTEGGASDDESYECHFQAIPADRPFRPARVSPKPLVYGPQTAVIVGPESEEIHTDEFGRVKVQFHWDRYGKADENASCWIRVAQNWAGKRWGAMFLPRRGQEVIVEFEEGDPDRPLITGRLYNADNPVPYDLPDFKTMSTIKSLSTPDGGGFNEIRFEDKADSEQIFIHAQKNMDLRVLNDRFEWIGNNDHLKVTNDRFVQVENDDHLTVTRDIVQKSDRDLHVSVGGKAAIKVSESRSLEVTGDVIDVFGGAHSEETTGDYYLTAGGIVIEASSGITLKCGSNSVVIGSSGVTIKGSQIVLDGSMVKIASGPGESAGSGSAGSLVGPTDPTAPEDADEADPGEMAEVRREHIEKGEGKYAAGSYTPHKPGAGEDPEKTWIEIELVDEDDNPVPGERYRVTLPDGTTVAEGTLDDKGFARVNNIEEPGQCKVTFPELDKDAWEPA